MIGTAIVTRANYLVDDEIDLTEALAELNIAIDDMSLEAPFEATAQFTLAADARSVTVPVTCLGLLEVRVDGVKIGAAKGPFSIASDVTGTPSSYYLLGDTLSFYPLNDTACTVDILFSSGYASMTTISESPSIPTRFHQGLVYWLVSQFKSMDDELNASAAYQLKYERYKAGLMFYQANRSVYWITEEE